LALYSEYWLEISKFLNFNQTCNTRLVCRYFSNLIHKNVGVLPIETFKSIKFYPLGSAQKKCTINIEESLFWPDEIVKMRELITLCANDDWPPLFLLDKPRLHGSVTGPMEIILECTADRVHRILLPISTSKTSELCVSIFWIRTLSGIFFEKFKIKGILLNPAFLQKCSLSNEFRFKSRLVRCKFSKLHLQMLEIAHQNYIEFFEKHIETTKLSLVNFIRFSPLQNFIVNKASVCKNIAIEINTACECTIEQQEFFDHLIDNAKTGSSTMNVEFRIPKEFYFRWPTSLDWPVRVNPTSENGWQWAEYDIKTENSGANKAIKVLILCKDGEVGRKMKTFILKV